MHRIEVDVMSWSRDWKCVDLRHLRAQKLTKESDVTEQNLAMASR